ncbi:uncharacterized protein JCM6883_005538, partial [Sporobolomyces salmoneus]|uniref:uncharacterized protein n=1 Tax=Sporobolomyces salmoneus TaxID=183962 RepID=UPI0031757A30
TTSDSHLIHLGSGAYQICDALLRRPLPETDEIIKEIQQFAKSRKIEESRIVLVADMQGMEKEVKQRLIEVRNELKLKKIIQGTTDLVRAVYESDPSSLFERDPDDATMDDESQSQSQARPTPTAAPSTFDQTPPFPTGGVGATHPESEYPNPSASASGSGGGGASGSASGLLGVRTQATQERDETTEAEPTATQAPKRLTRRAKTKNPEDMFGTMLNDDNDDQDRRGASSSSSRMTTRRGQSVEAEGSRSGSASMDLESAPSSFAAPPSAQGPAPSSSKPTLLKRRAKNATAAAPPLFYDFDSPQRSLDQGGATQGGSDNRHQEMVRESVPREERLKRLMEEDEREMAREQTQTQARGGAAAATGAEVGSSKGKGKGKEREKRERSQSREVEERANKKKKEQQVAEADKRSRSASDEEGAAASPPPTKRAKKVVVSTQTAPPKNKKETTALKKAEKEAAEKAQAKLLQMKVSKRKGAEADQAFNEDFNALKIVRPVLKSMPAREKKKIGWNEDDSDVERDRLIREDQEHAEDEGEDEMDPTKWRTVTQAMFNVRELEFEQKERAPRRNDIELPEKWAGRANFKRFRPKNSKEPRLPLADRPQIDLAIPDAVDFGLGEGYVDKKGGRSFSQAQHEESEDEDDELFAELAIGGSKGKKKATTTSKAKPAPKPKAPAKKSSAAAKGKGKAKQVVLDSDDEEESEAASSNTLKADVMDLDDDEDDDDDDGFGGGSGRGSKASSVASRRKAAPAASKRTTRKAAPQTIMIDDSDSDSDSGLTFKGFGRKG